MHTYYTCLSSITYYSICLRSISTWDDSSVSVLWETNILMKHHMIRTIFPNVEDVIEWVGSCASHLASVQMAEFYLLFSFASMVEINF